MISPIQAKHKPNNHALKHDHTVCNVTFFDKLWHLLLYLQLLLVHFVLSLHLFAPCFDHEHVLVGRKPHEHSKFVVFRGTLNAMLASIFKQFQYCLQAFFLLYILTSMLVYVLLYHKPCKHAHEQSSCRSQTLHTYLQAYLSASLRAQEGRFSSSSRTC